MPPTEPPPEPRWLREDVVLAMHRRLLAEHGGLAGARSVDLLRSALERPRNQLAYADPPPDLASLAAAYAYGIVRNHPFADGNKRTSLVACRTFLICNGVDIVATQADKVETWLQAASGVLSETDLADWIRGRLVSLI